MTTPPKYEDLVLKVAELERSEAALREELATLRESYESMRDRKNSIVDLQQRLTVAEQRAAELESAAREMIRIAGIANQGSNAYNRAIINMHAALNPATGRGGCGSGKPVPPSKPVAPPIRRVVNELVINKAEIEAHTTRNWRS